MDISGLESVIRAHPVLSGCVGAYILSVAVCLYIGYSNRSRFNKLKGWFRDKERFLNKHPYLLRNPDVRDAYRECCEVFGKD